MAYKILASEFRTSLTSVGIVAIQTNTGWKAYIGCCSTTSICDVQQIAAHGAKLKKKEALAFFPNLNKKKCENE